METKKWQYMRDVLTGLDDLDSRLDYWGNLGWELASMIHTTETGDQTEQNLIRPERWMLILKQLRTSTQDLQAQGIEGGSGR